MDATSDVSKDAKTLPKAAMTTKALAEDVMAKDPMNQGTGPVGCLVLLGPPVASPAATGSEAAALFPTNVPP